MSRQKYYYNKQTLQFEKFSRPLKSQIFRAFGLFSAILVTSTLLFFIVSNTFPSPKEQALIREIEQMRYQFVNANMKMDIMAEALGKIQERDANVHRFMFNMDPIDEAVWEGGIGGHDRYAHLTKYPNSSDLLVTTQQRLDKLEQQLKLQEESLNLIEKMASEKEKMLASIPSIKPVRIDLLKRKNISLLSGFGIRLHPIHKVRRMHAGIDFTAEKGTYIQATGDAVVKAVKYSAAGYGRHVILDHGFGYESLYGHMKDINIKVGQKVKKGQVIGSVGSTGTSTAPHCHYEVHFKGHAVDPISYCLDGLTPEEYQILVERSSIQNQSFD